ncbi:MAG TPA: outer membrane protein assembly factor BamC, partial [Burkholderiales bacterium]|nr:outer membrane protein assembly factor BamC [Burkholderiales bacterium]
MHKAARLAGYLLLALALGACSAIEIPTKKIDYRSAAKLPPLEIPPDLTRPGADERFAVPDINPRSGATYSAYSKERVGQAQQGDAAVLPAQDSVHVERAGTQRWLVVKGTPDQVWPIVKDFWQEVGFVVNVERPEAGVMETDWNENRAKVPDGIIRGTLGKLLDTLYSTSERDKFRTRLEPGAQPGTTEIYISHRGMEEVYTNSLKENTAWQPRPPDPELEAEMLRRLMVRFGVQQEVAKQQVAAAKELPQAQLSAGSALSLNEQFDRAWRRVGLALDRVGFTVEDRDRSKGIYFVRYIDPDTDRKEDRGWLSKLKFWGNDEAKKNERYRILLKEGPSGTDVNVLDKDGGQEKSDT